MTSIVRLRTPRELAILAAATGLLAACASATSSAPRTASTPPSPAPTPTAVEAMPVVPADAAAAAAEVNPFEGAEFYVNPDYRSRVSETATAYPDRAAALAKVQNQPTALWLDTIAAVANLPRWLDDASAQSKAKGRPVVPVIVVYNLPNRDCAAKASAGELTYEEGGEGRYRTEFIDKIAEHLSAHSAQRVVVILEPDSLPNVVTNLGVPKCAVSELLYKHSVAYAIARLSLPNVYIYLDAAHSGWLGWDGNRAGMASVFKEVLDMAGGVDRVRGFATNVSNYTTLSGGEGSTLEPSNPCPDELSYVTRLAASLAEVGITDKGFIIDTARNGRGGIRQKWGNWCNVEGAGLGERPRVAPTPLVDAYYWVKPPGESDGIADPSAARFDENCASEDAAAGAPEAGKWFESYFLGLVRNANPAL